MFDNPNADWDHDRVPNLVELNNGQKPCDPTDGEQFCKQAPGLCIKYTTAFSCNGTTTWTWAAVNANPNSDWDRDAITNIIEARNGANPCAHPCPYPTAADLALNPNGDWDLDARSNSLEVDLGTNPCNGIVYRPCPNWTTTAITANPHGDWDNDGVTNRDEYYQGTNPCKAPTIIITTPVTPPTYSAPYVEQPPPGYKCPTGYPYYDSTTGLCNTRPVVYRR